MTPTPKAGRYADMVRPLTEKERASLKESLERDGFWPTHPVVVDEEGTIILGHHRHAIAVELGIEPVIEVVHDLDEEEKARLAIADNVHRRQLTATEKAKLARNLREFGLSVRRISDVIGIPKSTVARAITTTAEEPEPPAVAEPPAGAGQPAGVPAGTPGRVTGRDGKSYRANGTKKPKSPPVTRQTTYGPDGISTDGFGKRNRNGTVSLAEKGNDNLRVVTGVDAIRAVARISRNVTPERFVALLADEDIGLNRDVRELLPAAGKWLAGVAKALAAGGQPPKPTSEMTVDDIAAEINAVVNRSSAGRR